MKSKKQLHLYGVLLSIAVLATVVTAGIATAQAVSSLVGYWNFEETSGTTSADVSGTGNGGTFTGNGITISPQVPPTTCYANERSLHFNGDGSYVNIPDTPSMDPDYISIAFWVKPDVITPQYQHIVFKQRIPGAATSYGVWLTNAGQPYVEFSDGGVSGLAGNTVLTPGQWNYVVATYDGSDINMYVNGALDGHRVYGNGPIQYGGYPLKVGHGDYNSAFQGSVDDLRIYNRALTAQEVADINAGGCGPGVAPADDGDGVTETEEDGAPNAGDGNNDGITDSRQANVTSFVNAITGKYVTVALDNNCSITSTATAIEAAQVAQDKGYSYPAGLLDFTANCGTPGYTTNVKLYFYDAEGDLIVRKYNPTTLQYATVAGATQTTQTIAGAAARVVEYEVVDGGLLDADGLVNGVIVDPVGLAVVASASEFVPGVPNTGVAPRTLDMVWILSGIAVLLGTVIIKGYNTPSNATLNK